MFAFALLAAASLAGTQDNFPKTADNRWAYDAVDLAKREKLIVMYPDDHFRGSPSSRYEFAVIFHAVATSHRERLEAFLKNSGSDTERASLLREATFLPIYRKAEKTFKRELVSLGVSDDFGQARIAALMKRVDATSEARHRPFRDVPADHWAAKAVGDMRALGLLDGYPDGRFHGSR